MSPAAHRWTVSKSTDTTPRTLPLWLRARLWLNARLLTGYLALCLSASAIAYLILRGELPGDLMLLVNRQVVTGTLLELRMVESKGTGRGQLPVRQFRYRYSFLLPNGQVISGTSTSSMNLYQNLGAKFKPGAAKREFPVPIEFYPSFPAKNRLRGTRIGDSGPFVFFGVLLPLSGVVLLIQGIVNRRISTCL